MEDAFIVMLVALFALAIIDLVVGVSNDAINFLSSAIGSKAISMRNILIIASIGVGVGAIFSSGLMEVARKGIFLPGEFYFQEIMIVFMAVMITDVLLLDFFNSLGLPTSTTVSIVFELLGAAVGMAFIKVYQDSGQFVEVFNFINTSKATEIIIGILLAVFLAFLIGAIVQYISRLFFSFQFQKRLTYFGPIFGGFSLTAIFYFILLQGLDGIPFIPQEFLESLLRNSLVVVFIAFFLFSALAYMAVRFLKVNILKVIVIVGTFALALAFAGNDLVNFIGVPIAAWQSFELWQEAFSASGVLPSEFLMTGLAGEVSTPVWMLFLAGVVMVLTLWFSRRARVVVETGVNLSRQDYGAERFQPTSLSRAVVRYSIFLGSIITAITPKKWNSFFDAQFRNSKVGQTNADTEPAFDLVRASVNLVVASILIAIGTNMQLPLSTTYVTFMVGMGTSLADRAWDRESAVYRVAGVFSVIGGWFITALVAFTGAALAALLIWWGGVIAISVLIGLAIFLLTRSAILLSRKRKEEKERKTFHPKDIITIQEIVKESSANISSIISRVNKMFSKTIDNLGYHDQKKLKKNKNDIKKLEAKIDELKGDVFYFIRSLDEKSLNASRFYIMNLDYLQDMVQSISFITRTSYNHVNNNHKNLKFNQIRDLKRVEGKLKLMFDDIEDIFNEGSFGRIDKILAGKQELQNELSLLIEKQIKRIRTSESSPKNSKLYFGLLLETRDLIASTMALLELFREFHVEVQKRR